MKKIIALMLICVLALSMTGCGNAEYDAAMGLYEAGNYAEAELLFAELGDYKDSIKLRLACRYGQAVDLYEAGSYQEAIQMFKKLGSYEDSAEMLQTCYYAWAREQQAAGAYESALELYAQAGGHEDSADRILECRQRYVTTLMADAQYDKAVPHLKALVKAGVLDRGSNAVGWCTLAAQLQDTGVYAAASKNYSYTIRLVQDDTIEIQAHMLMEEETKNRTQTEETTTVLDYAVKVGYNKAQAEMSYGYSVNTEITRYGKTHTEWYEESATAAADIAAFTPDRVTWENLQFSGEDQNKKAPTAAVNAMSALRLSDIYRELDSVLLDMDLGIALRDLGFVSLAV